jgi:hypothetical protein
MCSDFDDHEEVDVHTEGRTNSEKNLFQEGRNMQAINKIFT